MLDCKTSESTTTISGETLRMVRMLSDMQNYYVQKLLALPFLGYIHNWQIFWYRPKEWSAKATVRPQKRISFATLSTKEKYTWNIKLFVDISLQL